MLPRAAVGRPGRICLPSLIKVRERELSVPVQTDWMHSESSSIDKLKAWKHATSTTLVVEMRKCLIWGENAQDQPFSGYAVNKANCPGMGLWFHLRPHACIRRQQCSVVLSSTQYFLKNLSRSQQVSEVLSHSQQRPTALSGPQWHPVVPSSAQRRPVALSSATRSRI